MLTTGGGGWGDALEREPELVQRDVIEGKVSLAAARDDYGVVLVPGESAGSCTLDEQATASLRAKLHGRRRKDRPIIDRGDGYEKMLRGEVVPWTRSA